MKEFIREIIIALSLILLPVIITISILYIIKGLL